MMRASIILIICSYLLYSCSTGRKAYERGDYYTATLKVIVEQIRVPKNYQLSSDFFLNQVIEALANDRQNEFFIGQVYDKETVIEVSRDSVEVGTITLNDGTVKKVYNTVKAKLTSYRREIISNGLLDATIIEFPGNQVAVQRKFPGQFTWYTEWSTFNGDERALSKDQLALCDKKPVPAPRQQDLFIEFTKPI